MGAADCSLSPRLERPHRRHGKTLTAMLFSGGRAALAHVGDARAFRLRGGQLRQITGDHTTGNLVADAACSRQRSHSTWAVDLTVRPIGMGPAGR